MVIVASLFSVVAVSLLSLLGLMTLPLGEERVRKIAKFFVSFAVGALLGDAFIHLIPETLGVGSSRGAQIRQTAWILGGMLVFFLIEKFLRHEPRALHKHFSGRAGATRPEVAAINVLGDTVHNFIDGVLIGASYLTSTPLGVSTTLAVLLHEIPHELSDFAILVHSGLPMRKAVWVNLASASVAILGTSTVLVVGPFGGRALLSALLAATAGGFVYLAAADLIPELQRDRSLKGSLAQVGLMIGGVGVMALFVLIE